MGFYLFYMCKMSQEQPVKYTEAPMKKYSKKMHTSKKMKAGGKRMRGKNLMATRFEQRDLPVSTPTYNDKTGKMKAPRSKFRKGKPISNTLGI